MWTTWCGCVYDVIGCYFVEVRAVELGQNLYFTNILLFLLEVGFGDFRLMHCNVARDVNVSTI